MITALLLAFLQTPVEPMPPDYSVFLNEEVGGGAYHASMYCFAKEGPKSKRDLRRVKIIIARAHSKCSAQTDKLRSKLVKVFVK